MKRPPITASSEVRAFLDALEAMPRAKWRTVLDRFDRLNDRQWRKLADFIFDTSKSTTTWSRMTKAAEQEWSDELDRQQQRVSAIVGQLPMNTTRDPTFSTKMEFAIGKRLAAFQLAEPLGETPEGRRVLETLDHLFAGLTTSAHRSLTTSSAPRTNKRQPRLPAGYPQLVSLWDRIESQLRRPSDVDRLRHGEQLVYELFLRLNGDVQNGGFRQYLTNSAGDGAERAKAYLAEIGAWETLAILDDLSAFFPDGVIPADRPLREAIIEPDGEPTDDMEAALDDADARYARSQSTLYRQLLHYANTHRVDFA